MASTRNKNTIGNYNLETSQNYKSQFYTLYPNSQYGNAYDTKLPGVGLLAGQIPSNQLSQNSCDIESFLYGINSTNLVTPQNTFVPELKYIPSANIFYKPPTIIPQPLVIERNQRPFPI